MHQLHCDFVLYVILMFYVQSSIELLHAINHSFIHSSIHQSMSSFSLVRHNRAGHQQKNNGQSNP